MGSSSSHHQLPDHEDDDDQHQRDEDEEDEDDDDDDDDASVEGAPQPSAMKVLKQEPEILTCHASASPLSPQLSTVGTPRLLGGGPSIKVWDPCNVLGPPPHPSSSSSASFTSSSFADRLTEVFLVSHGECDASARPDLVSGRWPTAALTANGERQARALAVFLNSQGVRFSAAYSSPMDRARATAEFVCREVGFAEEQIQTSEALAEMSNGQWEGCHRSEIYNPEVLNLIDRTQPDFAAPSGESLRQVEFRMVEFLNRTVLRMPDKLSTSYMLIHQNENKGFSRHSSSNSVQDHSVPILPHWDPLSRHPRQGFARKKSGKSRLQFVTSGDNEAEDDFSPLDDSQLQETNTRSPASTVGIFTHALPIRCLLTGLLECSPAMSAKICIDDSSTTVLQHSLRTGWQIKRLNDTAHLRLL